MPIAARAAAVPLGPDAKKDGASAAKLRGQALLDNEAFADALKQYDLAISLAPDDVDAYSGAYSAAYELKEYARRSAMRNPLRTSRRPIRRIG